MTAYDNAAGYATQGEATEAAKISPLADHHRAFAIVWMFNDRYDFTGPDDLPFTPLEDGSMMQCGSIVARWSWSSRDRKWHRRRK